MLELNHITNRLPFHEKEVIRRRFMLVANKYTDDLIGTYRAGHEDPYSLWSKIFHEASYAIKIHHGIDLSLRIGE